MPSGIGSWTVLKTFSGEGRTTGAECRGSQGCSNIYLWSKAKIKLIVRLNHKEFAIAEARIFVSNVFL